MATQSQVRIGWKPLRMMKLNFYTILEMVNTIRFKQNKLKYKPPLLRWFFYL